MENKEKLAFAHELVNTLTSGQGMKEINECADAMTKSGITSKLVVGCIGYDAMAEFWKTKVKKLGKELDEDYIRAMVFSYILCHLIKNKDLMIISK